MGQSFGISFCGTPYNLPKSFQRFGPIYHGPEMNVKQSCSVIITRTEWADRQPVSFFVHHFGAVGLLSPFGDDLWAMINDHGSIREWTTHPG
jgi:hypothetical protein